MWSTPDFILGNSLPSLTGLDRFSVAYPALRAGLLSAVPIGTGSYDFPGASFTPRLAPFCFAKLIWTRVAELGPVLERQAPWKSPAGTTEKVIG